MIAGPIDYTRAWPTDDPPPPPIPAPEDPARTPEPEEVPRSPASLVKLAEAAGWSVDVKIARGPWISANGLKVTRIASALIVRGWIGRNAGWYAWWVTQANGAWKLEGCWWLRPHLEALSDAELRRRVRTWLDD
jgi:hypothetical protein